MNFYIFSLVIPLIIYGVFLFLQKLQKGKSFLWLRGLLRALPYLFLYLFLIYYADKEGFVDSGWAFYTLIFFLPLISIIAVILHFILKKRYKN
ncbi:hypothetical protein DSM03_11725 [Leeuwenhoekiella aestuarii]|nr:hypothetical protein DSM03_11725 [Leeuwenhoekiella aestuarii]